MSGFTRIRLVEDIVRGQVIDLPENAGVYAFWWMAPKPELLAGNRHIRLKGPGGKPVDVEFKDWWPRRLAHPCLYVGKTTNIKKRFSLHIKRSCPGRLHRGQAGNVKPKPVTTSCQLRFGIEHVFRTERDPLSLISRKVGFSYRVFDDKAISDRFFEEDLRVGLWRPWFNIDSER